MAICKLEADSNQPTPATLLAIARATNLSISFFERPALDLPPPQFRKRATLPIAKQRQLEAVANLHVDAYCCALRAVRIKPPKQLPDLAGSTPEEAAAEMRRFLALHPHDPVPHVTAALEQAGWIVLHLPVAAAKFDAFSTHCGNRPVIALGTTRAGNGDRQRLTLGHETAHIAMHQRGDIEHDVAEQQANQFAGCFLMPRHAILPDLQRSPLTPIGLAPLKAKWRVSIAALFMRACDLQLVEGTNARSRFFRELSARGWRTVEPVPIPTERPQVFRKLLQLIQRRMQGSDVTETCGGVSSQDLLEMTGFAG